MRIERVETLHCHAGWRPWSFVKVTTDSGLVGYSECTEAHGSALGVAAVIQDLAPLLIGQDPRRVERIHGELYRRTRQSAGGIVAKALGGIENALLDIKAKALGVPVYELFGGPLRDSLDVYWSHCGTTRARAWELVGRPKLASLDDVVALGAEVAQAGFPALKTNLVVPGDDPQVLMPGFAKGPLLDCHPSPALVRGVADLLAAFEEGAGPGVQLCLDVNFNQRTEGNLAIARAVERFDMLWLEVDSGDPQALRQVKDGSRVTIASGENLYGARAYRPYLEAHAMDVALVDVIWNGLHQAKKIADMAELYEMGVAAHNHNSHLSTLISAHFSAIVPNHRILEVDVDDVPWKDDLVTCPPSLKDGRLEIPTGPGWGADLDETVLAAHPWPPPGP